MTPPAAEAVASTEDSAKNGTLESSDVKDTEMVDAPTESAKPPSPPAEPATEAPAAATADTSADPVDEAAKLSPKPEQIPSAMETTETAETAETTEPVVKPEPETVASREKSDGAGIEQEDATGAIDTQSTAATEAQLGDLMTPTASMSQMAIGGVSQDSNAEPLTTDTSMTDAPPQSSAKVARERDEDDEAPAAKRVRTSGESEAPAEAAQASQTVVVPDAMTVDTPAEASAPASVPAPATAPDQATATAPESNSAANASPAPRSASGTGLTMIDPSIEPNPITGYQSKQIRTILGLIKKTKAGAQFKQSVQILWPGLWESYRQSISQPVDITTIEKRLREGHYTCLGDFKKDVQLIEDNAVTFNGMNHDVSKWAKTTVEQIFHRMALLPAEEPAKPAKPDQKAPTRQLDRKAAPPPAKKEVRPVASSPADKTNESPAFSLLPSGVPNIRRDSTKTDTDRPKRPIHPPKNRDLGFPAKTARNKRKPELRFCEEMLKELMATKNWSANQWFMEPVDPVALNIPTYHSVVKQPMDLGTMKGKLDNGEYESAKDFKSDFGLIVRNCVKFNSENSTVTATVRELEKIFDKKWSEKASWISKHAPPPAPSVSATSPRGGIKDDTDDEEASDAEAQDLLSSERKDLERALETLNTRLKAENAELEKKLESTDPDFAAIELQRSIVTHLQNTRMEKRIALNKLAGDTKKGPSKTSKKRAAGGGGGSGGAPRKTGGGAQGASKKASGGAAAARKAVKKKLSDGEKEIVSEGISRLEDNALERAITIIKKDTGLKVSMVLGCWCLV